MNWKKILAVVGIGIAVYAGMRYLFWAAVPFLLGWFLAGLVLPAAKWMERKLHIRRGIAGGILIGLLTVLLAVVVWKLSGLLHWLSFKSPCCIYCFNILLYFS